MSNFKIYEEAKKAEKKPTFLKLCQDSDGEVRLFVADEAGRQAATILFINPERGCIRLKREPDLSSYGFKLKDGFVEVAE